MQRKALEYKISNLHRANQQERNFMVAYPPKVKLIEYILIALIIGFFVIPMVALCLFDCKIFPPQKITSIFLFFFR